MDTPAMQKRWAAVERLITEHFDGDGTMAMLAVAHAAGIAVAYQNRESIEGGRHPLTDEEWAAIRPYLEDYDEWLSNSGAVESIDYWIDRLFDQANINLDDGGVGS